MDNLRFATVNSFEAESIPFDLSIACLGYESRAITVTKSFFQNARIKAAIGFDREKVLAFEANRKWYYENNVQLLPDVEEHSFQQTLEKLIVDSSTGTQEKLKIAVDISCFDRHRLAVICQTTLNLVKSGQGEVWFYYCIAAYDPPEPGFSINARLQPVHPSFVGQRLDPLAGTTAIIGLGYEREKALGAAEYLEADPVFTYCPSSRIEEYLPSVQEANELLLSQLSPDLRFVYEVEQPAQLISDLSSLVKGLLLRSAVIMIPLGPKIFALACLITASIFPAISVWRMSQSGASVPIDRRPTENFSILKVSS